MESPSSHLISSCPVSTNSILLINAREDTVIAASAAAHRLFKYPIDNNNSNSIIGKKWDDILLDDPSLDQPDSKLETVRLLRIREPEADVNELDPEPRHVQACGHKVDIEGLDSYIVWFLDDVTHVRDLAKAVETDRDHLKSLDISLESTDAQTIVLSINSFGRIVQAYPMTTFLGYHTENLLNRFIMRFVVQDDVPELCRGLSRACRPFGYAVFMVRWSWTSCLDEAQSDTSQDQSLSDTESTNVDSDTDDHDEPLDDNIAEMQAYIDARVRSTTASISTVPGSPALPLSLEQQQILQHSPLLLPDTIFSVPHSPLPLLDDPFDTPPPPPLSRRSSITEPPPSPSPLQASKPTTPPPTWVHFTVGPTPASPGDESSDAEPRHLLCLIQIVRATSPDGTEELVEEEAFLDAWIRHIKEWLEKAGCMFSKFLWMLWRVWIVPTLVVGRVGGFLIKCL